MFQRDPAMLGIVRPAPPPTGEASLEECRDAYAQCKELSARAERRWTWVSVIGSVTGVALGATVATLLAARRAAKEP
jgi:hypothetical protein